MYYFTILITCCWFCISTAFAGDKVALIIGNSQYQTASDVLKNPVNDAQAVATRFKELGYDTQTILNANLGQTLNSLNKLNQRVSPGGTVVLYYAGHGVQLDGQNYIVPVDASMKDRDYVSRQAIKIQELIDKLEQTQASNRIVILDACRNDPFPKQYRSGNRGLVREQLQSSSGLMILYAASPNEVADDGKGKHGVFTQVLLNSLNQAGTRLPEMMDDIRLQVRKQTSGKQNPYYEGTGLSRFMFLPASAKQNEHALETAAWDKIKNSNTPNDFQAFLKKYPSGIFADTAQVLIEQLASTTLTSTEHHLHTAQLNRQSSQYSDEELMKKGMWRDPNTNLIWMRCSMGQTWNGERCVGKPQIFKFFNTFYAVSIFNNEGFAGFKDWEIPHIEDLSTLIYCSKGFEQTIAIPAHDLKDWQILTKNVQASCANHNYQIPTINTQIFPNTSADNYLTTFAPKLGSIKARWGVDFKTGKVADHPKFDKAALRLVRRPFKDQ